MSTEPKPKVRLKLKIGNVEAEIECEESQLKGAVEQFLTAIQNQSEKLAAVTTTSKEEMPIKKDTCKSLLVGLWKEGWFSTARTLREVYEEMSRRGYHYDPSAIAHMLVDIVREGYLTREGVARQYTYVQKRPPTG
jgi:hypothetical protein